MIKLPEHLVFVSPLRHKETNANTGLTDTADKGRKLDLLLFLGLYYLFILCFCELKFSFFEQPVSLKFKVEPKTKKSDKLNDLCDLTPHKISRTFDPYRASDIFCLIHDALEVQPSPVLSQDPLESLETEAANNSYGKQTNLL